MFSINSREAITKPLTAVDSDREVVLSQNHLFRIVLPSNPTTGYSWNVSIDDSKIVAIESSNYVADNSGRVGVGGETTWVLMTHNKGNARLTFSYQRPWEEKVAPTRVVTFSINVR
jgi:inhibitor of cysteine peptidase